MMATDRPNRKEMQQKILDLTLRNTLSNHGMVKSDLIEKLKSRTDLSRNQAEKVVNIFFESISAALLQGDRAEIRGFGSFSINRYESYVGRNPKTGARIKVPSKKLPFFRVGKELRENVDKNKGG